MGVLGGYCFVVHCFLLGSLFRGSLSVVVFKSGDPCGLPGIKPSPCSVADNRKHGYYGLCNGNGKNEVNNYYILLSNALEGFCLSYISRLRRVG